VAFQHHRHAATELDWAVARGLQPQIAASGTDGLRGNTGCLRSAETLLGASPVGARGQAASTRTALSGHTGVRCGAHQRKELERLCRYITRPAIANQRLKRSRAGQVVLQLKSPYRDATTHIVMSPLEFIQRLAALVPPPEAASDSLPWRARAPRHVACCDRSESSAPGNRARSRSDSRAWRAGAYELYRARTYGSLLDVRMTQNPNRPLPSVSPYLYMASPVRSYPLGWSDPKSQKVSAGSDAAMLTIPRIRMRYVRWNAISLFQGRRKLGRMPATRSGKIAPVTLTTTSLEKRHGNPQK
jgi:hypothetical protein